MTPEAVISALAAGARVSAGWLLPSCRAHAFGVEAFGPSEIHALFARRPAPLSRTPDAIAAPGCLALFDADAEGCEQAWFAELHESRIGRLWRLGDGAPDEHLAEPALGVAANPFPSQHRDGVTWRPEDHPNLSPEAATALIETVREHAEGGCLVVLRAFSVADRAAALLARGPRLAALSIRHESGHAVHSRLIWNPQTSKSSCLLSFNKEDFFSEEKTKEQKT